MGELAGKVAVVSGASKGMGRHFVAALIGAGMKVAALARPSPQLDSLEGEHGDRVLAIGCDVASPDAVNAAIANAADHFGRIDVLVNNAAVFHPFAFADGSDEIIRQHVEINLLGVSWLIRAAIPHLKATQGQIVSISSESVNLPFPMLALYAATKAAVETLSAGLRDELRSDAIRVTVLRSGSVSGGSGGDGWSDATRQAFFAKIVETGHAAMSGSPATPQSMAKALIATLELPRDISVDLIEVRAAQEGMPEGARATAGSAA
ncbi:NADP-dependent 3-hydroxy acid dehydrogenase YdfG [Novosphingobium kunmingense]|uniref:NADP-dependent 3-hydroxy acid dehydrogenase YdfG n=1 Tax=Novosphingobium kunmingense TaxID=1211806 RepID=A0A2N0H5X4_9SPHN|nr:SDR family NAD(P)-dependent oxidoreductase [Novosphingobium kunmingense]PKB14361.1 NADP-dependent 3-hydroxy acid dehydrogenase YdfG [Novosphingobium kunmingense]